MFCRNGRLRNALLRAVCACCASACGVSTDAVPNSEGHASRRICTGVDGFTFQRANSNKLAGSVFGILWRNGAAYLRVDGHCRYYAYHMYRNDPIVTGTLSEKEAQSLALETRYDTWPRSRWTRRNGLCPRCSR